MEKEKSIRPELSKEEQKTALGEKIHGYLEKAFVARQESASDAKITRLTGFSDGYAQAVIDAGIFTEEEILDIVKEERQKAQQAA